MPSEEDLEERIVELEGRLEKRIEEVAELDEQVADLKDRLETSEDTVVELEERITRLSNDLDSCKDELKEADMRLADIATMLPFPTGFAPGSEITHEFLLALRDEFERLRTGSEKRELHALSGMVEEKN